MPHRIITHKFASDQKLNAAVRKYRGDVTCPKRLLGLKVYKNTRFTYKTSNQPECHVVGELSRREVSFHGILFLTERTSAFITGVGSLDKVPEAEESNCLDEHVGPCSSATRYFVLTSLVNDALALQDNSWKMC
ncbi:unnamed protein product [Soboliphyme baturini]|uniref:rRNA N-glycosidase n=1 Tax=Soboliphyme baturini TaxID=241478 RepID=A0A183IKX9_9BILA|nr:unnamed protein product [Soboliphyme baturini]